MTFHRQLNGPPHTAGGPQEMGMVSKLLADFEQREVRVLALGLGTGELGSDEARVSPRGAHRERSARARDMAAGRQ